MSRLRRLGLRARLATALGAVAVAAVALATLLANRGLDASLTDFARERLQASADHTAALAARFYQREGGWNERVADELRHVAQANQMSLVVIDAAGRHVLAPTGARPADAERASAPVRVGARRVGTVSVASLGSGLLTEEEQDLRSRLDSQHMVAGLLAVALALLAAVLVASSLTRPIRRLTEAARRVERGDLSTRLRGDGGGAEIEQLAHALDRLSRTLEREEELRRATVADVAHELRTPVSGILGRIEAAQDGVLDDERANLESMHTEALRLTRLIEDIGRLADAERPGLLLDRTALDLADVARARAAVYGELFERKQIRFRQQLSPAAMHGDRGRLEQVVDNLLSNALRYTDPDGAVVLSTRRQDADVLLEVADTGHGIPPEDLPHLFTRFWRGERSRSRATGGTGVGLAIASELVRAHGGRIEVDSAVGEGTTMRVTLPAGPEPHAPKTDPIR
ncbi:sensor histidine kinase [Thermoleophilum album]|uniref:histidine kinase n=1 Tax=Thermoleophilum album TaxID=29539 RepID=A0A1H6G1R8_THEAL|nr:ATP-binding protein [Thermoleophilum album]SEH16223.1 two-component system, OmpR family, sensor histidine kinase BaeS [Thermoleophilum album]